MENELDFSTTFYDFTGRGRPKGVFVNTLTQRSSAVLLESTEPSKEDESVEQIVAKSSTKKKKKKKSADKLSVVCEPVELPIKRDERSMHFILLPCLQFPLDYKSPTKLLIDTWRRYHSMSVSFCQREIGYFSTADRSDRGRTREDHRYLRKLIYPIEKVQVRFDLNSGADYLNIKEPLPALDAILWWLIRHKDEIYEKDKFNIEFLGWRGTLRRIMSSLFDSHLDWCLAVIRWRGCHFMSMVQTETEEKLSNESSPIDKRMQYWGHKFEDYVSKNPVPLIPSPKKIFATINKATLGRYTLLYSSEIDGCVDHPETTSPPTYIELKTVEATHLLDLQTSSSRKYSKWWQQCFLTGIQQILLGFRDDSGIVHSLQPLNVKDIETHAKTWSSCSFLSFLNEFCSFVQQTVQTDWTEENNNVFLFYFSPMEKLIKWRLSNDNQYQFLPEWFRKEFC